jgi:hypothetical protein
VNQFTTRRIYIIVEQAPYALPAKKAWLRRRTNN